MSRPRNAALVAVVLPAVIGLGALSGCGAGQVSQTASQASAVNGYSGQIGSILVRNASIAFAGQANAAAIYRTGGAAPLDMTLVNQGSQPDKLISAASPVAGSVQVQGDAAIGADQTISVGNTDTPGDASSLAARTIKITLTGLKQDIKAGSNYPVQLTFQRAGTLTANLPVGYPSGALAIRGAKPEPAEAAPGERAAAPAGEPRAHAGNAAGTAPGATAGTPSTRGASPAPNAQTGPNSGSRTSSAPGAPNPPRTSAPASPNRSSTPTTSTTPGNS